MKQMKSNLSKKYSTIGCCGIDCGLCPQYHTDGKSRCPGCVGVNFFEKHPSCSIVTCCIKNNQFETCADCKDLPCEKMINWDKADSFVTHKNTLSNLRTIREHGLTAFIKNQKVRIKFLDKIIKEYDDGRSKSFFCLALTLLSIDDIQTAINEMKSHKNKINDQKLLAKSFKDILQKKANSKGIELIYRNKKA
jgi:hypothetical protein